MAILEPDPNDSVVVEPLRIFLRSISSDSSSIFLDRMRNHAFCTAHTIGPEPEKLSELRRKTDRQLHDLVHSKLDLGLSFAVLAEVEVSAGDRAYAEQSLGRANEALVEVQRLLPALTEEHRAYLNSKLNELRKAVGRL